MDKHLCSRQESSLCTLKRWQNPGYPWIKPVIAQEREEQGKQIASEEKQQVEVLKPQEHSKFMSSGNYQRRKKDSICAAAGVRNRVVVSKKTGLALKTALGLSWRKYVRQKRILASLGVKFESETKERELKHTIVKEHVTVKNKNVCVYDDSKTNEVVENPCQLHTLHTYLHLSLISWISIVRLDSWCGMGYPHMKFGWRWGLTMVKAV